MNNFKYSIYSLELEALEVLMHKLEKQKERKKERKKESLANVFTLKSS